MYQFSFSYICLQELTTCIIFVHLSFSLSLYSWPPVDMLHVKFDVRLKIFNLQLYL